ncbi:protein YgfX [Pseudomonas mangiferae]|uniref:Toxin CptA n=1 Tax=Pseudomonas mangiferae TaxID=2593654 RepID=A0A553H2D9_9PSED|nr:protein YgfX [Pseudomonas mangiferae]TRX75889.1 hypothetical protein FM069_05490 [Pseudomonas mangiferae]
MSSRSDRFECHWRPSRRLLTLYLALQALVLVALLTSDLPTWSVVIGIALALLHGLWTVPRHVALSASSAFTGLRHEGESWSLWRARDGWLPVRLHPDSLALPLAVVLRFRLEGGRRVQGVCIPGDALPATEHRRLRVRLRFSRRRWAEPE